MSGTVIVCSGQGGQGPQMFDLVAAEPAVAPVFSAAAEALGGQDPRDLALQGDRVVHRNAIAQMLCCTATLAAWAVLEPFVTRPLIVAGYSAGEMPAWAVAGIIGAPATITLTARRAALMDEETEVPAGLAAIVGLPRDTVEIVCRAHGLDVAIVNGPAHFIIGGRAIDLDAALDDATWRGARRAVRLPVDVASHTPRLRTAGERFADALREGIGQGTIPGDVRLISGIDGARSLDRGWYCKARGANLAAQISTPIDWAACMATCFAARPARILELGPGSALARMMTEVEPDVPARSLSDFRSLEGVKRWLRTSD